MKCRLFLVLFSLHRRDKKSCSPEGSINPAKGSAVPGRSASADPSSAVLDVSAASLPPSPQPHWPLGISVASSSRDTSLSQASPGEAFALHVPLFHTEVYI